jgi:hypothetical protein
VTRYEIVPATTQHAEELAITIRQADCEEVIAQSGVHPSLALGMSLGNSVSAWAGLIDGEVACMMGVSESDPLTGEVGIPWMLGSDLIVKHQRAFLRRNHQLVETMQNMFPVLENFVDVRNAAAIGWLKWLGFDILPTVQHGPFKLPFHPFRRVRV